MSKQNIINLIDSRIRHVLVELEGSASNEIRILHEDMSRKGQMLGRSSIMKVKSFCSDEIKAATDSICEVITKFIMTSGVEYSEELSNKLKEKVKGNFINIGNYRERSPIKNIEASPTLTSQFNKAESEIDDERKRGLEKINTEIDLLMLALKNDDKEDKPKSSFTPNKMYAFISYQTEDKVTAGMIKKILSDVGVSSFMAHEDINVSEEWRLKILEEIGKTDIFISLWSKNYNESLWCIQESGIASFRKEMTIIPLSLDGSVPKGFAGNIQSTKIDPDNVYLNDLIPGITKANLDWGIEIIYKIIAGSHSFRGAEENFRLLLPYTDSLSPEQGKRILEISVKNNQVHHASLCASEYLPPLMAKHGHLLNEEDHKDLSEILERYAD